MDGCARDQSGRPDERLAQGVRFLRSVGLDELLAETLEDYVRIATELAGDLAPWPNYAPDYANE